MGKNYRRGISRCSQGQGALAWHYLHHWLGLAVNCCSRTITLSPRGLPGSFSWKGARIGSALFDIAWKENDNATTIAVTNLNDEAWDLMVGVRDAGAGICGPVRKSA